MLRCVSEFSQHLGERWKGKKKKTSKKHYSTWDPNIWKEVPEEPTRHNIQTVWSPLKSSYGYSRPSECTRCHPDTFSQTDSWILNTLSINPLPPCKSPPLIQHCNHLCLGCTDPRSYRRERLKILSASHLSEVSFGIEECLRRMSRTPNSRLWIRQLLRSMDPM